MGDLERTETAAPAGRCCDLEARADRSSAFDPNGKDQGFCFDISGS